MAVHWIRQIMLFFILVFLQVLIFNRIDIFGFATPLFYIYFILKLPVNLNRNIVLLLSFLIGFVIDLFSYTYGLNALACTLTGFIRHYAFLLFLPRELSEFNEPSIKNFGLNSFFKYVIFLVLIHHIVLFTTEALSLFDLKALLLRIAGSAILTVLLIFAAEGLNFSNLKNDRTKK